MLEPYDGKLSRTVLRGLTLLDTKTDNKKIPTNRDINKIKIIYLCTLI
jgi:hypothetical protein